MKSRRRVVLLALGLLLAAGSVVAALLAIRAERRAREPFWLEDPDTSEVSSLAFSPDGEWLVGGARHGGVCI